MDVQEAGAATEHPDTRPGAGAQRAVRHLTALLSAVSGSADESDALADGARRVAAAMDAQLAAVVRDGRVEARVGIDRTAVPDALLTRLASAGTSDDAVERAGLHLRCVPLDDGLGLVVGRTGRPLRPAEVALLRDIGQGFAMALRMARAAREERALREESERQSEERAALLASLGERSRLLERLLRIQRSISHQAPPEEIFDAITAGASELLGLGIASLRLEDPEDPDTLVMISSFGIPPATVAAIRRAPRGRGASGRAFEQGRLVVVDEYHRSDEVHEAYVTHGLQAAMAAPVHERGRVVGSLTVASYEPGRRFSPMEQEALLAFAEHASLALADARTLADLRDAQRARDMFLAGVSHELKTPLTVIMGALRTLERREPALSPEVRDRLLAAAFERGRDLERLIDRLLQGARAELASQRHRVRLPDLLERAVEGFEHGQRLVLGEVPDTEAVLDDSAVRSILGVLLENAASHGAPGSTVGVNVAVDDAEVCIAVESEGSLPAELSERELFEPFRRGASATSSGVGLGLSIAARVAASAGGRMTAESADGKVVFTLRLPYEPGATPPDPGR